MTVAALSTTILRPDPWRVIDDARRAILRSITILRPSQRVVHIPGIGVRISGRAVSAGGGWWDNFGAIAGCVAAYQPKGAASLAASYIDLSGNGNNCVPVVAPALGANGWQFDGVTTYLTTPIIPANGYAMVARFADSAAAVWREVAGSAGTLSTRFRIGPRSVFGATRYYGYGSLNTTPGASLAAGRMFLTATQPYLNGAPDGAATAPAWAGVPVAIWIGRYNNNGVPGAGPWDGTVAALAVYSAAPSAAQIAAQDVLIAAL